MVPKWHQKRFRSPRPCKEQATKVSVKLTKRHAKITPRRILKSQETVWVALFHLKNMTSGGYVLSFSDSGSNQNDIRVYRNQGPTFSRKTLFTLSKTLTNNNLLETPIKSPENQTHVKKKTSETKTAQTQKKKSDTLKQKSTSLGSGPVGHHSAPSGSLLPEG